MSHTTLHCYQCGAVAHYQCETCKGPLCGPDYQRHNLRACRNRIADNIAFYGPRYGLLASYRVVADKMEQRGIRY